jgi:hypothetical protein
MDTNEKSRQQDYYRILLPEVPSDNLDTFLGIGEKYSSIIPKRKYALNIPDVGSSAPAAPPAPAAEAKVTDIGAATPLDIPDVGADPLGGGAEAPLDAFGPQDNAIEDTTVDKDALAVLLDIEDIKHTLQTLKTELRINDTKEEIHFEVEQMIKSVRKEIDDIKARKVPVRKEYDTEGAYKEQLYPQVVNILDDILVPLVNTVPDYNLLATQISSTYDDGTIKNAIVSVTVILINNDYKYEFKADVPILNGLIQSPQYLTRSRKIIPLTEEAMYLELNSESFIKLSPDYRQKDNMFSNIGENMLRQQDKQKVYPTDSQEQHSEISGEKTWIPNKQRGLIDER